MPQSHYIREAIKQRRRRGLKIRRPPRPIHPKAIQIAYFKKLKKSVLLALRHVLKTIIVPALPNILASATALRPRRAFTHDDFSDDIHHTITKAKIHYEKLMPEHQVKAIVDRIARRTNTFNAEDTARVFKSSLGVDVFRSEPWLTQEMKGFVHENVKLIKTIPQQFFDRIEGNVWRAAKKGTLAKDLADKLERDYDVTESRAALIARDQVSKFNSGLTKFRQQEVGVTSYIWQTAEDERVRPTHEELDQTEQSWDDPPVSEENGETNHPGEAINCRCVAIPVMEGGEEEGDEEE